MGSLRYAPPFQGIRNASSRWQMGRRTLWKAASSEPPVGRGLTPLSAVAADAENDVVVRYQLPGIVLLDDLPAVHIEDPVLPVPNELEFLRDLDGDIRTFAKPS